MTRPLQSLCKLLLRLFCKIILNSKLSWLICCRYFSESYGPKPSILIKIFVKGLYDDLGYFENGRFETANISPTPTRTNMPLKSNFVQMRINFINIMEFSSTIHLEHHNSLLKVFQIFKKYRLICKICVIFQLSTQLHSASLSSTQLCLQLRRNAYLHIS